MLLIAAWIAPVSADGINVGGLHVGLGSGPGSVSVGVSIGRNTTGAPSLASVNANVGLGAQTTTASVNARLGTGSVLGGPTTANANLGLGNSTNANVSVGLGSLLNTDLSLLIPGSTLIPGVVIPPTGSPPPPAVSTTTGVQTPQASDSSDSQFNAGAMGGASRVAMLAMKRRCGEILADPGSFDDDLVNLCKLARRGQ